MEILVTGAAGFIGMHVSKKLLERGVLGLTFKENCPDLRNSRTVDIIRELESYGIEVFVHDPWADEDEAQQVYGATITPWEKLPPAEAIVVAVAHEQFRRLGPAALALKTGPNPVLVDAKSIYERSTFEQAGFTVWQL